MEKYAGIDIAKRTHWMCVTDGEGRFLMEPRPYDNDAEGLSRMVADLDLYGGDVAVGMESTGCYWRSCCKVLAGGRLPGLGHQPCQDVRRAQVRQPGPRQDRPRGLPGGRRHAAQAGHPAHALARRRRRPASRPVPLQAHGLGIALAREDSDGGAPRPGVARVRQAVLGQVRGLLPSGASPASPWTKWTPTAWPTICAGRAATRFGAAKASDVLQSLRSTCGVSATGALRLQLRLLLDQLDFCAAQLAEIDAGADALLDAVAPTLPTVPGGPRHRRPDSRRGRRRDRFCDAKSLVAYAGLDPTRRQSGGFDPDRNRISKRGSAHLRRSLHRRPGVAARRLRVPRFLRQAAGQGLLPPLRRVRCGAEDALRGVGAHALGRGVRPRQAPGKGKGPEGASPSDAG